MPNLSTTTALTGIVSYPANGYAASMSSLLIKIAVIGIAGIGAQWAAWRIRIPAIALLLLAGFILGPVAGYLDPKETFGDLYKPVIALAVSIILFEGGLSLNFKEIRETSVGVRRIILVAGPLVWFGSVMAAHYGAGLSWPSSLVLGAILIVTGPTVIMPLLRNAQLGPRPASLLRWEAIVNDPIGALFAVLSFEIYFVLYGSHDGTDLLMRIILAAIIAIGGGYAAGYFIARIFRRGRVPEFLKAPVLLVTVLVMYAVSDLALKESGLLTVTVMGIMLANTKLASLTEMRRFKETVTVLLVSGLFIMLTASLKLESLTSLGWGAVIFVVLILFIVRPIAIFIATIGSGLDIRERALIAWIAPRGIVAVAVSGLFGASLADMGVADGSQLTALTFAVVASTIILHGFTLKPLASWLGLKSAERPGVLIVGGSSWSDAFAEKLKEIDLPVLVADSNWNRIRETRLADTPVYFGEVLSEGAHHDITFNRYSHLVAATDNDAYNSLVCTEFGPELGRGNVFQIGVPGEDGKARNSYAFTVGGRTLFKPGKSLSELRSNLYKGWTFQSTKISDEFTFDDYMESRADGTALILWVAPNGDITFRAADREAKPDEGDTLIAFGPKPDKPEKPKSEPGRQEREKRAQKA